MRQIHRYLGLVLCLVMLNISITGILLVWKPEYLWLTIQQARAPLNYDLSDLAGAMRNIETKHPPESIKLIQLYSEDLALHKVFLNEKQYAWHDQQGTIIQQWGSNERFEDWLLDLHHRFLLGNKIGLNIAGFGGLLLIPLSCIGLFLWWPRRRTLKLGVIPGAYRHGVLMRSHFNLGSLSFLPILILSITGVILVYPTEARNILLPTNAETTDTPAITIVEKKIPSTWHERLNYATKTFPDSRVRWVAYSNSNANKYTIGLQQQSSWNRMGNTTVSFESDSSIIQGDAMQRSNTERLMDFTYPLHVGKLPLWYRLLLTIFGFSLMAVSSMGLWSYVAGHTAKK